MRAGKVVLMAVGAIAIVLVLGIGIAGCQAANGATSQSRVPDFLQTGKVYVPVSIGGDPIQVVETRADGWLKVRVHQTSGRNERTLEGCWLHPQQFNVAICPAE